MKRFFFILRFILFGNLFFWLGHALLHQWVAKTIIFSDGHLDYAEFLLVFLLLSVSIATGWLVAAFYGTKTKKPLAVEWQQDDHKDTVTDIVMPLEFEKIEAQSSADVKEPASKQKNSKHKLFQQEIHRNKPRKSQ